MCHCISMVWGTWGSISEPHTPPEQWDGWTWVNLRMWEVLWRWVNTWMTPKKCQWPEGVLHTTILWWLLSHLVQLTNIPSRIEGVGPSFTLFDTDNDISLIRNGIHGDKTRCSPWVIVTKMGFFWHHYDWALYQFMTVIRLKERHGICL